jgi:hypothetical protein
VALSAGGGGHARRGGTVGESGGAGRPPQVRLREQGSTGA